MQAAIDETGRRRKKQLKFNKDNNITPVGILKKVKDIIQYKINNINYSTVTDLAKFLGLSIS